MMRSKVLASVTAPSALLLLAAGEDSGGSKSALVTEKTSALADHGLQSAGVKAAVKV